MAVKAKVERLGICPRFSISARIVFSSSSSGVSASASSLSASWSDAGDSTALRLLVLSPDWEECASSTISPKRLPGSSPISWADDRELLEGGDDDGLARFQCVLELARGGVDVLHHPQGLLELPHRGLELAVQYPAVGDDYDGVEYPAVIRVVQRGKLVSEPGDGEALAAPGRVLDEVALSRPQGTGIRHEPAHAVELLIARKDEEPLAGLAPPFRLPPQPHG